MKKKSIYPLKNNIDDNEQIITSIGGCKTTLGMFPGIWTIDELFEEFNPETNDNLAEVTARKPLDLDEFEILLWP